MNTEDKKDDKRAVDFGFGQLDASLLEFAQDKEGSAGAGRRSAKLSAVGAAKKTQ
jgi:hypothetical protein